MILVIDNYDSFTYNLVDLLKREDEVQVFRNDEIDIPLVQDLQPAGIVISPGPGRPSDSGASYTITEHFIGKVPILGVCLGHQIIAEVLGGRIIHAQQPMHGKTSLIFHKNTSVFHGLTNPIRVMRYHSLLIDPASVPESLEISARTEAEEIMGIQHKLYNLAGVQFHPESVLSEQGEQMIRNWAESWK